MEILKGLPVANAINEKICEQMQNWEGSAPCLAIIRVGERQDDIAYERSAVKKMEKLGLDCRLFTFPEQITDGEFQKKFDEINECSEISGILLLRPLPEHLDEKAVENRICPDKDLDGMSPVNQARIYAGDERGFAPCTAEAVMEMLDYAGVDPEGKRAVVIGRSLVIGRPAAMLLLKRNATVTVCHTRTRDVADVCRQAQILVAAAGVPRMVTEDYVGEGAVVIDVGIHVDAEGQLCGDVYPEKISGIASIGTPVPGGVGSVTTSVLAKHLMEAARRMLQNGKKQ